MRWLVPSLTDDQVFQLLQTIVVALATILAALLGALAGVTYQQSRNKPRLRVAGKWGFPVTAAGVGPTILSVEAANVGPVAMSVEECGFRLTDGQQMTLTSDVYQQMPLPATVQPGHSVSIHVEFAEVQKQLQRTAEEAQREIGVKDTYARDGTGRRWYGPVNAKNVRAAPVRRP